ncbi:MAG: RIP metalloprotease RseP [Porphyromonadaceae bacterium CG2_30_38_12]|nr:MAG: RIP metalloprotease RseP [Porphyromonadaceae bacterium CG2_30_38_12]
MDTFLIRALQLILSLSILVVLHEFGHFAFARLFRVRVDKFYMFFNPNFSLIRAKRINGVWQFRFFAANVPANERPKQDANGKELLNEKGKPVMEPIPLNELSEGDWRKYPDNTEWGIGWLPLGGYCKIAGMIDESMDSTQLAAEPQTWEYRAKPVWQRLPIIIGGVLVNFILAMVIYAGVLFTWGQEYLPFSQAKYGLQFSETLQKNGLKNGDIILTVDGKPVEQRAELVEALLIDGKQQLRVKRQHEELDITLPKDLAQSVLAAEEMNFVSVRFPFVVAEVSAGSPAEEAKLQANDSVVGINGSSLFLFQDIAQALDAAKGKTIRLDYVRSGKLQHTKIAVSENGKLGVGVKQAFDFFPTKRITYSFVEAIPAGINLGWETLASYVKQLKLVFSKEGAKQLGGFGSIGKMFPQTWDWQIFWSMTALLSVILAFMNFLPIPALDGGHVIFLLYEMVTGRKPSDKFMEYAQSAGMFILFGLLIFANGNDIFKALFK